MADAVSLSLATPSVARLESEAFSAEHLAVRRLAGREAISQLYQFDVLLVHRQAARGDTRVDAPVVQPSGMVGATVRLVVSAGDGSHVRTIDGLVKSASLRADETSIVHPAYELSVVPRAWSATLVAIQEIFMDMTVPEIIAEKLTRVGLADYATFRTTAVYDKREFVVQYRESDLAFIMRLAEHVGLSFHFEHGEAGETMVFTDQLGGFQSFGDQRVPYAPRGEMRGVYEIITESRMVPAIYAVQDYNYRLPDVDLGVAAQVIDGSAGGVVEYGTHHKTPQEGLIFAKARAEETESGRIVHSGKGVIGGFTAGAQLHLEDHPFHGDEDLLLTSVTHRLEIPLGGEQAGGGVYENAFTAVPASRPYRPPRLTPRPRIHGVLSGIIQPGPGGAVGGNAKLDEHGRYTVQFHFDTARQGEQKASKPVRMAQPFAGPDEGLHFPLKPGTEVLLVFVDGDPDRPVIVGALPNPGTPSPVTAKNAQVNQIKTDTGVMIQFGRN